jgi:hypothetical protein
MNGNKIIASPYSISVVDKISVINKCNKEFKHLLKGNYMKLKVGGLYKTRDGRKAEVVYINNNLQDVYRVVYLISGETRTYSCRTSGNQLSGHNSPYDLIEEWQEPSPLNITVDDVGKKVRLRNGSVALITAVLTNTVYLPVSTGYGGRKADGKSTDEDDAFDIVEVLNDTK